MIIQNTDLARNSKEEKYLKKAQYIYLYGNLMPAVFSNLVLAFLISFLYLGIVPLTQFYLSINLILISTIIWGGLHLYYKNTGMLQRKEGFWERIYISALVISALAWGSTSFLIYPENSPVEQNFLLLILAGLTAGTVVSISAHFKLTLFYIQALLLPLLLKIFLARPEKFISQMIMLIVFNLFLCGTALTLYRKIKKNLSLEFDHRSALKKLNLSEQRFEQIFHEAPTGIFYYNRDLILEDCNEGLLDILQAYKVSLKGLALDQMPDKRMTGALQQIREDKNGYYEGPYHTMTSDLDLIITLRTSPIKNSRGEIVGGVAIMEDITERVRIQNAIRHQAYHDSLTGLPNRQLLMDRLSQALKSAQRHHHKGVLLYMDLDKFKLINDSTGHQAGDRLLKQVSLRLTEILREEDTVSRVGGDEFVILLPEITPEEEASVLYTSQVADKIHNVFSPPFAIDGQMIHTSTSIGITIFNGEEQNPEKILKYADTAMYHAKSQGRRKTSFFHKEMDAMMQDQISMEKDLREALINNSLEIYLQPIVDIMENRIKGAEALLRWYHPEQGFISPEKIISTAEKSGQIVPLGKWIFRKTLSIYSNMLRNTTLQLDYVSINISIKQMMQPDFVKETLQYINESSIPAERITLEITESILITDFENTVEKMRQLREKGFQFALDDFGTGYSSLSYLKKLPLDRLKIDKTFTENMLSDGDDYALVDTIMSIARHFNLEVVTEGVEEKDQVNILKDMNCPYYQGYFCSKPVPPDDFVKMAGKFNALSAPKIPQL